MQAIERHLQRSIQVDVRTCCRETQRTKHEQPQHHCVRAGACVYVHCTHTIVHLPTLSFTCRCAASGWQRAVRGPSLLSDVGLVRDH